MAPSPGFYRGLAPWVVSYGLVATLVFCYIDQAPFLRGEMSRGQPFGRDFAVFWTASRLALEGQIIEIFDPLLFHKALARFFGESSAFSPFPYPPLGLWPVLPLGLIPYLWSFLVWSLLTLVLYLSVAAEGPNASKQRLVLLLAPATILTFPLGQNGLLTAALFLAGLSCLDRRPVLAGLCFALLTFKPQLGLLIPIALLAGRHWRAFLVAVAGTLILLLWSLWFAGLEGWRQHLDHGLGEHMAFLERGTGFFMYMIPSPFMAARIVGVDPSIGYGLQMLTAILAAAGVAWAFHRASDSGLRNIALISGTFLASPWILNYDMTLLSVAILRLAERGLSKGFLRGEVSILILSWFLPLAVMFLNAATLPIGPIILVFLFVLILYRIRRSQSKGPSVPASMSSLRLTRN